ncbi:MAG: F0F1 ATP synthase subunit A, partial [Acidobacteriota bacterium]|nr:F0F1 ATP synthase subunit A [Acidobacteriota bacterium]
MWLTVALENVGMVAGHPSEAGEPFNAGKTILEHVANNAGNPIIRLPELFGIDFSITKHVFMLWAVALLVFFGITWIVRRYLKAGTVPSKTGTGLEMVVSYIRDSIVLPNVGAKWVDTWSPLILTLFFFILTANLVGLVPIFDVLKLGNHYLLHADMHHSIFGRLLEGGTTATANFNVTAGLAFITFISIIVAGSKANGFINHWKNIVP